MRKIFMLAIFVTLSHFKYGFSVSCLENATCHLSHEGKTYISSDKVVVQDEGMFVNIDDNWFQIDSLFTDENGLFFKKCGRKDDHRCEKYYVSCRNCDRCVRESYDICPYCGKPV